MDYVYLQGHEDVSRAASSMRSAADDMLRAANMIADSNFQLMQAFTAFCERVEIAMDRPK